MTPLRYTVSPRMTVVAMTGATSRYGLAKSGLVIPVREISTDFSILTVPIASGVLFPVHRPTVCGEAELSLAAGRSDPGRNGSESNERVPGSH
jgi:hypothetical protein